MRYVNSIFSLLNFQSKVIAQSAGAVEYTKYISAAG